ncbi:tryptophan synthase subunit alpha [Streptomyces paradoxus]|uniref:Tryptophan synthase alpha chain n=1 Tax=Streptomyces paradoxus TaxID=66375 RepID=A0A7W9WLT1_9ACTN|nr:tryptophan synthase subunit alpha [Streptomyces paradoxus]MBB6080960.1 tryptophan synthase alpha chain [Streptomyces paradoxus]
MITSMRPSWSAARLDYALATSRSEQRAALGLYLPVGYPSRTASLDALHLMAKHADVLELGLPHSDPHMDGPVIRQACAQALDSGFEMIDLFTAATELTAATTTALVVMSYWAPIARFGPELFAERLAVAGGAGVLIPDLPEREAATWHWAAREAGLHTIPLVPAHASNARLAEIGSASSGMVYAPATPGRTGAQRPLSPYLPRQVRRLRYATGLPVAVGIGISTPEQAARASTYADAVMVGSAVIRRMRTWSNAPDLAAAQAAKTFADGVRRASSSAR